MNTSRSLLRAAILGVALAALGATAAAQTLLNVSYDPTRELYQEFNAAFIKHWKGKTGQTVTIKQSHGGSGGQARAVSTDSKRTSSRSRWPTTSTRWRSPG